MKEETKIIEKTCQCEDLPVTYCRKCKSFYVVENEIHDEILIDEDPYSSDLFN